jgi:hypothetical protein
LWNRFGSCSYAAEELIAELGAAFLCAEFGFDGDVLNAGYIGPWIELLKADKRAFFTACSPGIQGCGLPARLGARRARRNRGVRVPPVTSNVRHEPLFRNFYKCYRCNEEWEDVWSATCDDDCPHCGARHCSPYKSEDEEESF